MAQAHKFRKTKSLFSTTLASGISTGTGETITLNSVSGLPTDTEITLTFDRVDSNGTSLGSQVERITGIIDSGALTAYTRGVDGTTEQAHSAGAVIEYIWNADDLNDIIDGILTNHAQDGHIKSGAQINDTTADHQYVLGVSELTADRTVTLPLLTGNDEFVFKDHTQTLTNKTLTSPTITTPTLQGNINGWTLDTDTWVYVSASTFKIEGKDVSARFPKGTRLKLTNTTLKYFVVTAVSFSTDTTVTVTGGTDYALASAAISTPYYSYESCPQGYPGTFAYTPTLDGFAAGGDPTGTYRFSVDANICHLTVSQTVNGTSDANNFTITLPITASTAQSYGGSLGPFVYDNGSLSTTSDSYLISAAAPTIVSLYKAQSVTGWTTSNAKRAGYFQVDYAI